MNRRSLSTTIPIACLCIAVMGMMTSQTRSITKTEAGAAAEAFLKAANLPAPKELPEVREMPRYTALKNRWEVTFPGDYRFTIHKADGTVGGFQNYRRIGEQFKRTQDRSKRRFASADQALPYVHAMALKLGLRPQARRTSLEYISEGDPKKTDSNRAGRISVSYRTKPFGYDFHPPEIGNGLGMSIDPVDGVLVSFAQHWDVKIDSHTVKVSRAKATSFAEGVFRPYRKKHRSFHTTADQAIAKVELKYVIPNVAFDSKYPVREGVRLARLAYIVYFGNENVWIDSATGKLLGGESFI